MMKVIPDDSEVFIMPEEITLEQVEKAIETPRVRQRVKEILAEAGEVAEVAGRGVLEVVHGIGKAITRPETMEKLKGLSESLHRGMRSGEISVMDIGDVEVVRLNRDLIVSMPKGRDVFLVHKGATGLTGTTIKKLEEII